MMHRQHFPKAFSFICIAASLTSSDHIGLAFRAQHWPSLNAAKGSPVFSDRNVHHAGINGCDVSTQRRCVYYSPLPFKFAQKCCLTSKAAEADHPAAFLLSVKPHFQPSLCLDIEPELREQSEQVQWQNPSAQENRRRGLPGIEPGSLRSERSILPLNNNPRLHLHHFLSYIAYKENLFQNNIRKGEQGNMPTLVPRLSRHRSCKFILHLLILT